MQATSVKAYHEIREELPRMRAVVYFAYLELLTGLPEGSYPTAGELRDWMLERREYRSHAGGSWKRLSELADLHGLIQRGPARKCTVTGRSAIQWTLAPR